MISLWVSQYSPVIQVVFEDMGMQGLAVATGPELALRHHLTQKPSAPFHAAAAGLVIDAGFSFIHVVPFLDGQVCSFGAAGVMLRSMAYTQACQLAFAHAGKKSVPGKLGNSFLWLAADGSACLQTPCTVGHSCN